MNRSAAAPREMAEFDKIAFQRVSTPFTEGTLNADFLQLCGSRMNVATQRFHFSCCKLCFALI
jgi:hypothetical protein